MRRTTIFLATVALAMSMMTASADTHLWVTTEGAGLEVTTPGYEHPAPPPPPYGPHHHHHHKSCRCNICKKHHKQMHKDAKKFHKDDRKKHRHQRHH